VEFKLDEDGELLIKGHGVISSYYNNAEATRESVTSDGWFRTGDIAEMDDNGYIRILDRKKLLIVLDSGKKISQARLEALCITSPLIDQVAIVGQDREYISALIVPNYEFILRVLRSHGIPFDESQVVYENVNDISTCVEVGSDIMQNDLVRLAMQDQIDMINSNLREYEAIKAFRMLRHRFCEEQGELSHANKLKMKTILERYQDIIDDMYKVQAN
jgi:long-chain acyl-CoA synthetase